MVITCAADVVECILCQGYQMVYFQTQNPSLGKFGRALQWNMSAYFVVIWSILWSIGIFDGQLVYFMVSWYIIPVLVYCTKKCLATLFYAMVTYNFSDDVEK
jgi:hypothetical protein